jgi:hypothetical protein
MKAMMLFAVALALIVLGGGLLLAIPFSSPNERRAIEVSGVVAVVVQLFGFAIARSVPSQNFFSGWVIGIALRFVTLITYAFVAVKLLGLPAPAALISLVTFLFVSTLVEPKLLTL